jgi:hypothetical protein
MSKLLDMIREQRRRRLGSDDLMVVYLGKLCPTAHREQRPLEQAPDESFEIFEARAIAAAKAAGDCVVTITVPEGGGLVTATTQKVDDRFWEKKEPLVR